MELFLAILFFPGNHMFLTFNFVAAAGLIWIYFFGVLKIKKTVAPVNGVVSTPSEWASAKKSANIYSLVLFTISITFFYLLSLYEPEKGDIDAIVVFLGGIATLTLMMTGIIQIMNKLTTDMWIKKE